MREVQGQTQVGGGTGASGKPPRAKLGLKYGGPISTRPLPEVGSGK